MSATQGDADRGICAGDDGASDQADSFAFTAIDDIEDKLNVTLLTS